MSLMSKMRRPRSRSWLTVACTPCAPQSRRPVPLSLDTNSRLWYTDTSLCEAGQKYAVVSTGWLGDEMFQTWKPL